MTDTSSAYAGQERRTPPDANTPFEAHAIGRFQLIEKRLSEGSTEMNGLRKDLDNNNRATNEVLEIVRMGKNFFKVSNWLGKGIAWLAGVTTSIASIWYLITHGAQK